MMNMATFCLNNFSIRHLQNLSSYDIVYRCKLLAIIDLQLEGYDLTHPPIYHFTDYLDLMNRYITLHHNKTIKKGLQKHGSENPFLHSFNEGDIVYCHFPSKSIVISASDDRYRCSTCDEAGTQVVQRSRIPKLRAAKGSEDLTKNNSR